MASKKSNFKNPDSQIKKALSTLKKLGLYKPRSKKVTRYSKTLIKKYAEIIPALQTGKATVVRVDRDSSYSGVTRGKKRLTIVNYDGITNRAIYNKRSKKIFKYKKTKAGTYKSETISFDDIPEELNENQSLGVTFKRGTGYELVTFDDVEEFENFVNEYSGESGKKKKFKNIQNHVELLTFIPARKK